MVLDGDDFDDGGDSGTVQRADGEANGLGPQSLDDCWPMTILSSVDFKELRVDGTALCKSYSVVLQRFWKCDCRARHPAKKLFLSSITKKKKLPWAKIYEN